MRAGDGEVAPLAVHLHGGLRLWRIRHTPTYAAGNDPAHQDMDAGLAGRVFRVALELVEGGLRPGVDAAIRVDTVIQVHAGIVPLEDIAQAVIMTSALGWLRLGIAGPGLRIIRVGFTAGRRAVGHFGELAPALLLAPAHPLRTCLQFFQRGELSCGRNIIRLWDHGYKTFLTEEETWN